MDHDHTAPETNGAASGAAAAHLLEMTARDADQWLDDAKREAAELLDRAREEAAGIVASAHEEAARVRADLGEVRRLTAESRDSLRLHLTEMLERVDGPAPGDDA